MGCPFNSVAKHGSFIEQKACMRLDILYLGCKFISSVSRVNLGALDLLRGTLGFTV
jgi:hypothetical protein